MAQMSSKQMMGQFGGHANPLNGVHKQLPPSEVPQKPFNVKGDAGIPTGKNGDGDPMTGGSCY